MACCLYKYILILDLGDLYLIFTPMFILNYSVPSRGSSLFLLPKPLTILKPQRAARNGRTWWLSLGQMETSLMKNRYGNLQSHGHERIRIMTFLMTDIWVKNMGLVRICHGPQAKQWEIWNSSPPSLWIMLVLGKGNFKILTPHVMRHQFYTCSLIADPLIGEVSHPPLSKKSKHPGLEAF